MFQVLFLFPEFLVTVGLEQKWFCIIAVNAEIFITKAMIFELTLSLWYKGCVKKSS